MNDALSEDEWEQVFDQIKGDLQYGGDFTALFEMLDQLPPRILRGYVKNSGEGLPD